MGVPNGTAKTNGHASPRAAEYNLPSHFIGGNRLDVAVPSAVRDFVAQHEGHSVITSVGFLPFFALYIYICPIPRRKSFQTRLLSNDLLIYSLCTSRFSSQTTVLPLSRRSGRYGNGRTRHSEMSGLFSSRSWRRRKICRPMQIIFVWQINMLRCVFFPLPENRLALRIAY